MTTSTSRANVKKQQSSITSFFGSAGVKKKKVEATKPSSDNEKFIEERKDNEQQNTEEFENEASKTIEKNRKKSKYKEQLNNKELKTEECPKIEKSVNASKDKNDNDFLKVSQRKDRCLKIDSDEEIRPKRRKRIRRGIEDDSDEDGKHSVNPLDEKNFKVAAKKYKEEEEAKVETEKEKEKKEQEKECEVKDIEMKDSEIYGNTYNSIEDTSLPISEKAKPSASKAAKKTPNSNINCIESKNENAKQQPRTKEIYDPEQEDPFDRVGWEHGEPVPYKALSIVFSYIEKASSRLTIQQYLTDFFLSIQLASPKSLLPCVYLCVSSHLSPPFEGVQLGIGDALLLSAIADATGSTLSALRKTYQKIGDLGEVAQGTKKAQRTLGFAKLSSSTKKFHLTIDNVLDRFRKMAKLSGGSSRKHKVSTITNLLVKATEGLEARYLIRGLQGKLRIGLAEKTIIICIAHSIMSYLSYSRYQLSKRSKTTWKKPSSEVLEESVNIIKQAFCECPNYDLMVPALQQPTDYLKEDKNFCEIFKELLSNCHLVSGTPVSPMLARPTKTYAMVFDRFATQSFTCEYKYDGERAQIHIVDEKTVRIFSRNFEDSTERFPDVVQSIREALCGPKSIKNAIIDTEVVAFDKAKNQRLPFQILSTRARKNVEIKDIKVPVCIYAFDLLYLNGQSYLQDSLRTRRSKLHEIFKTLPGVFEYADHFDVLNKADGKLHKKVSTSESDDNSNIYVVDDDEDEGLDATTLLEKKVDRIQTYLQEAVSANCEGLMVKTLEATYEPSKRSHKWLKLKKDYLEGVGDSVDVVPIGAFHGKGKRTGVYGAYLLACYDPETEMYQCLTKLGTGLSDDILKSFATTFKSYVRESNKPRLDYLVTEGNEVPDVWFEPMEVWEVLGADLSISPKYPAAIGLVSKEKGISLRFPRFIRRREDKTVTQTTSAAQIAQLYRDQGLATNGEDDDDEDDII